MFLFAATTVGCLCSGYLTHLAARNVACDINSDSLYLVGLFRDLFIHRVPPNGWIVPPAPYLFPDFVVLAPLLAILEDAVIATYAYGWITFLAIGLLALRSSHQLRLSRPRGVVAALIVISTLAVLAIRERQLSNLLFQNHHGGAVLSSLWVFVELLGYLRPGLRPGGSRLWTQVALLALGLTAAFDGIAILYGLVPTLAVASATLFVSRDRPIRSAWVLVETAFLTPGSIWLGKKTQEIIGYSGSFQVSEVDISIAQIYRSFGVLPGAVSTSYAPALASALWLLCIAIGSAWSIEGSVSRAWRGRFDATRTFAGLLIFLPLLSILLSVAASGKLQNMWSVRYLLALWVYPVMIFGVLLVTCTQRKHFLALALSFICLFGFFWNRIDANPASAPMADRALTRRPPPVACVERFAERVGIYRGYGTYWVARRATELSHAELRILPVTEDFQLYRWIVNTYWWEHRPRAGSYLIIELGLNPQLLSARIHSERVIDRVTCPEWGQVIALESQNNP